MHCSRITSLTIPASILLVLLLAVSLATAHHAKLRTAPPDKALAGRYIVVLRDDNDNDNLLDDQAVHDCVKDFTEAETELVYERSFFNGIKGFEVRVIEEDSNSTENGDSVVAASQQRSERILQRMLDSDMVDFIEEEQVYSATESQNPTWNWGVDRIDQQELPLNSQYSFQETGFGVQVYVLDTGIRTTHVDFDGRASCGRNFVPNESCEDNNGHGTHVAGIIGSETFGVAKDADLIAVKVLGGIDGVGSTAGILGGFEYVLQQALSNVGRPIVVNASLGGPYSRALNRAARRLTQAGVFVSAAAGNDNEDACTVSPSSEASVMSVAASTSRDSRASFSNYGSCVDIFAPGQSIPSTWASGDRSYVSNSGTSMAAPHVAGVAALHLQRDPTLTPADLTNSILNDAVPNMLRNVNGSPNLLLQLGDLSTRSSVESITETAVPTRSPTTAPTPFPTSEPTRKTIPSQTVKPTWLNENPTEQPHDDDLADTTVAIEEEEESDFSSSAMQVLVWISYLLVSLSVLLLQ